MEDYTPFEKPLADLCAADLESLQRAAEGWYIEYKRAVPESVALAKSLAAFANTYGGWLFLGIEERSKEHSVAGAFPGIARDEVDAALQRLRKGAADFLTPTPHYEVRAVWGPDASLGLADDHAVICIWVPASRAAPHVHKRGYIYRRVADASEPRPESDRAALDGLWRRGDEVRRHHRQWHEADPDFSKGEAGLPYLRVMLTADPWRLPGSSVARWKGDVFAEAASIFMQGPLAFDTCHTCADGLVARQLQGNAPEALGLTWNLRRGFRSDIVIPLSHALLDESGRLEIDFLGYEQIGAFAALLRARGARRLRVVDLNLLFNVLLAVAEVQERLNAAADWPGSYFAKAKLLNCWRVCPFLDIPGVVESFRRYGPAMCLTESATFPQGAGPDDYIEVARHAELADGPARWIVQAHLLFSLFANAFGVPDWIAAGEGQSQVRYLHDLEAAGRRALEVQAMRNER